MTLADDLGLDSKALKGKTALITGASSGIGWETALLLGKYVGKLHLVARRGDRLGLLREKLTGHSHLEVQTHAGDLTSSGFLSELCQQGAYACDIFVNNAGGAIGLDEVADASEADWDQMLDINVRAAFKLAKHVLPYMIQRKNGHIVNLTSVASHVSYAKGSVYCATKAALLAFAKSLRSELCAHNIRVSNISPGMVETEFSVVRFHGDEKRAKAVYEGMQPLTAVDIARQILFCLLQPPHVDIDEVYITPVAQGEVGKVIRTTL